MAAFLTALMMTVCFCQAVFAADTAGIDTARQGALTIDLKTVGETTTTKTATIAVYRAGEWDGSQGRYELIESFQGSEADIHNLSTAEDLRKVSQILDQYALDQNIEETALQTTSNGEARFTGLSTGLYLVCQREGTSDNVTMSPFLTTLPVLDDETNTWNYEVNCYPKSQADTPDSPGDNDHGGGGGGDDGGGDSPNRTDLTDTPDTVTTIDPGEVPQAGLPIEIEEEGALELARRSRGTPRLANRLLKRVRDFAQVKYDGTITKEVANYALDLLDVDKYGLDHIDRGILVTMIEKFQGGPVGLDTLAAAVSEDAGTLEDVYEPYLLKNGFIQRTPRGRVVTELAYRHLGIPSPHWDA